MGAFHIVNLALTKPEWVKSMGLIGPAAGRRAGEHLRNATVEFIPGGNHITGVSQPDLTNDAILRFLKQ